MAKLVIPNNNTKFDPFNEHNKTAIDLGLNTQTVPQKQFNIDSQRDRLNTFSNIDLNEFSDDVTGDSVSLFSNDSEARDILSEQRAQNQSASEQLFKGVGRILTTVGTEIGKVPGYVGGGVAALIGEATDPLTGKETNSMSIMVDNMWVNAFEKLDEDIKSTMPIYLTKDVQEGNIVDKLGSSAWWSTTGADGIGFLLSMYAPGQFLKAAKIGSFLAGGLEGIGNSSKLLGKTLTSANILSKGEFGAINASSKLINNLDSGAAVLANTFIESSAEAANTFDNIKKSYLQANPNATEEEINTNAGNAAANVFKTNMALLLVSNAIDEVLLFKGFNQSADKVAKQSLIGRLFKDGKIDLEAAKKIGIKKASMDAATAIPKAFAKEGLFEEGLQYEVQTHFEDVANNKTKKEFTEDVLGDYFDDLFTSPEMQESVVLGGILGGGASLVGSVTNYKAEKDILFGREAKTNDSFMGRLLNRKQKDAQPGLANILQDNYINSFRTIHDIAKLDNDNKPILDNGKVVIDETKLQSFVDQKEKMLTLNQLHNIAILEGNKEEQEMYGNMLSFNYFLPFLQQEGGYEVLQQHIGDQLTDLMVNKAEAAGVKITEEQKESTKKELLAKAKSYNDIYQEVKNNTNTELSVKKNKDNAEKYSNWQSDVFNKKLQALISYQEVEKKLNTLNSTFNFVDENNKIKVLTEDELNALSPVDVIKYEMYKKIRPQLDSLLEKSKETYITLSKKEGLKKSFEEYSKKVEEEQAELEKENENNTQTIATQLTEDDFYNSIAEAGYTVLNSDSVAGAYIKEEKIIVEDNKKNRYTLQSVYDYKTKKVTHLLIDKAGKITNVSEQDGSLKADFLKRGIKPITKKQIELERKALSIKNHKDSQLKLISEILDFKKKETVRTKDKLSEVDKQIEEYQVELEKVKAEIDKYYLKNIQNRAVVPKSTLGRLRNKKKLLTELEKTINNLKVRRNNLQNTIAKLELFTIEYAKFLESVRELDQFSVAEEKKKVDSDILNAINDIKKDILLSNDIVNINNQIIQSKELVDEFTAKIEQLEKLRESLVKVIKSHEALFQMMKVNKDKLKEATIKLKEVFNGIVLPYNIDRVVELIQKDNVLEGETLAKNNIITNALSAVEYFNNPINERQKLEIFNTVGQDISESDIYDLIKSIFKQYEATDQELKTQYGYSPEQMYALEENLLMTKKEIADLKNKIDAEKSTQNVLDLQKKYIMLDELMLDKVANRFAEIKKEQDLRNVDSTQRQSESFEHEPLPLKEGIRSGKLSPSEYSTTGKNLNSIDKNEELDANGYPLLNENTFQQLWFKFVDKHSTNISDFVLIPVHAKYDEDTTDELQKYINANNPKSRGATDVFVFLANKDGSLIKADNQGNISSKGNYVLTSLRLSDEMFGAEQKIIPDNLITAFLLDKGLTDRVFYEQTDSKKTINDVIKSKKGREYFKNYLDNNVEQLLKLATTHAKEKYDNFIKEAMKGKGYIPIDYITKGFPLYKIVNGKKVKSKVLDVLPELSLNREFGVNQLQGGKLGLVINQKIKIGEKFVSLPPGTVYLQTADNTTVQLDSRNINDSEIKTIMFLLSLAEGNAPLNTINIPFPYRKKGDQHYYFLNGKKIENVIPVFYRKSKDGTDTFSLLHSLINYGAKDKSKNKKGEIFIQSGNIIFTTFTGETKSVSLIDLKKAINSDNFNNFNNTVAELYSFLSEKRFNINKTLLGNNPLFLYPQLKKVNGEYTVEFDTSKTYYSFLLDNVLTTTLTKPTDTHPRFLQRNIVYKPEIKPISVQPRNSTTTTQSSTAPTQVVAPTPVAAPTSAPTYSGISLSVYNSTVDTMNRALANAITRMTKDEVIGKIAESKEANISNQTEQAFNALTIQGNGESLLTKDAIKEIVTNAFEKTVEEFIGKAETKLSVEQVVNKNEEPRKSTFDPRSDSNDNIGGTPVEKLTADDYYGSALSLYYTNAADTGLEKIEKGVADTLTAAEILDLKKWFPSAIERLTDTINDSKNVNAKPEIKKALEKALVELKLHRTTFDYILKKETKVETKTEESVVEKKAISLKEKMALMRSNNPGVTKTPTVNPIVKPADKVISTETLINSLIEKGVVQKQCK
jgi:hypothetical protein